MVNRRQILAASAATAFSWRCPSIARGQERVRAVDILGREVALVRPARRIVIGTSVNLDALALAHPEPVGLIAGWSGFVSSLGEEQKASLVGRFPRLNDIPVIGRLSVDTLSPEAIIACQPDLVIFNLYDLGGAGADGDLPALRQLAAAGIPVLVVDFFLDPLKNSGPSLRALGAALGTLTRVEDFLSWYENRLSALRAAIAKVPERPAVFMHAHAAGSECCYSPGRGALDGFIDLAGGRNIGAEVLQTATGQLSLEYVLSRDPDFYVATAGYAKASASGFTLGRGVGEEAARQGFVRLLEQSELAVLGAVRSKHAHAIWHDFAQSPLHVLAIEAMARWFHPEPFRDLDPAASLAEINARFTAMPLDGTFWLSAA